MRHNRFVLMVMCALLLLAVSVPGVFAVWSYFGPPEPVESSVAITMGEFRYGLLYITRVSTIGGDYSAASVSKTADLDIRTDITLNRRAASSVVVDVTFYNSTDVSYYYKETQAKTWDNDTIGFASDVSDRQRAS